MDVKTNSESPALPVAEVALLDRADRPFDYCIPGHMSPSLIPGMRVLVPFRGEWLTGVVIRRLPSSQHPSPKPILRMLDPVPLLDEEMLGFTRWLSEYYLSGWGPALRTVLPPIIDTPIRKTLILTPRGEKQREKAGREGSLSRMILDYLAGRKKGFRLATVVKRFNKVPGSKKSGTSGNFIQKSIRPLIKKGWVSLIREVPPDTLSRVLGAGPPDGSDSLSGKASPFEPASPRDSPGSGLNEKECREIYTALEKKTFLSGFVPGADPGLWLPSLIRKTRRSGRNVLILVPEIQGVGEWEKRLRRAGLSDITILHSGLPDPIRKREWLALRNGRGGIVLGTRMAVLSPLVRIGLIVVMDEDDPSYKQEESPRYHARDVAVLKASREKAVILLTAVHPSIETYSNIQKGKYRLISPEPSPGSSPRGGQVRILPLGKESGKPHLSGELIREVALRLKRLEPVVLILNQKGMGSALYCRDCGTVIRCPRCNVSAVFSKETHVLACPYCAWDRTPPETCDECHGRKLTLLGFGTEQAEATFKKTFPGVRIARVEGGAGGFKKSREALKQLNNGELDILIGTQIILSAPPLEKAGLVGLLQADGAFHHPDFRAGEKTFRLVSRVLAFASHGDVLIQTFFPHHESISWAEKGTPESYYKAEMEERKTLSYPPFTRLAVITVKSGLNSRARVVAGRLADVLSGHPDLADSQVLGPAPSLRGRRFGKFRWQVMIKVADGPGLHRVLNPIIQLIRKEKESAGVWFEVDVDPVHVG